MTDRQSGCARADCCQREPDGVDEGLEAAVRRVVIKMLERDIEAPRPSGDFLARSANVCVAIGCALRTEMERRRAAGVEFETWPDGSLSVPCRVIRHSAAGGDYVGVDRYRVVGEPHLETVLDFVVVGGLCVVTNGRGSWIVHSPAMQPAVTP